jgi:hypothetical protein
MANNQSNKAMKHLTLAKSFEAIKRFNASSYCFMPSSFHPSTIFYAQFCIFLTLYEK